MKFIATDGAPKAIGPYSQAVVEGGFLFASGQIPLDPATGELVAGGIEASTERVFDNLEAVLARVRAHVRRRRQGDRLPHADAKTSPP